MNRSNILYIHSHDTGRYVEPYGYAVPTPNIQRLAAEGVLFRQAFCAGPTCSPSRAALLTGLYPHNNGMLGLAHRGFALNDYNRHLLHPLRQAGYHTAAVGVQHIARRSVKVGYDETLDTRTKSTVDVAPAAAAFLRRPAPQPFFLSVGFWETHREFENPGPDQDPRYTRVPTTLPDTPAIREDFAGFMTSARMLDDGIGQVLHALAENNLAQDTLVICTTDHGVPFPGNKCTLTDHGIGVMLVMRGPGSFQGGRVCDALVSHLDLYPTLCDVCEIEPPEWLQGKSLMPLLRGETEQIHDQVLAEINYHAAYEPQRAVRTHRFKYIRRFDGRSRPVLPNTDDSPGKTLWLEHGWRDRPLATERLYDLIFDPNEADNRAADPDYASVLDDMRERLSLWMQQTADPLLHGAVRAPAGAMVNDTDGVSPSEPVQPASDPVGE